MTDIDKNTEKMAALGRLTRGLIHDFNNSLASILGYADFLVTDLPADSEQRLFAGNIQKAGLQLQDLIDQIRAFSAERKQGRDNNINILPEIRLLIDSYKPILENGQKIEFSTNIDGAHIFMPMHQLRTLFDNVIKNAVQALEDKPGTVSIHIDGISSSSELAGRMIDANATPYKLASDIIPFEASSYPLVRVLIRDTGCGMDDTIFNLAHTPHFTTKTAFGAHGMGLAVSTGIVSYLDGGFTLASTLEHGTCVTITLPVSQIDVKQKPHVIGSKSILLVEDREMVRETIKTMLMRDNHTVETVSDPYLALDKLRESPKNYDMLMTDYLMPGLSGKELIDEIRHDFKSLPIILISGDPEYLSEIDKNGSDKHLFVLPKPTTLQNLKRVLEAASA